MIAVVWLSAVAIAGSTGFTVRSETAAEMYPAQSGKPAAWAAERLGVTIDLSNRLSISASGAATTIIAEQGHQDLLLSLWDLSLTTRGPVHNVQVGRVTRLDHRGFQYLDGADAVLFSGEPLELKAWGGRLWATETWSVGETWVGGVSADFRPPTNHVPSKTVQLTLGWEGRGGDHDFHQRLLAATILGQDHTVHGRIVGELEIMGSQVKGDFSSHIQVPVKRHWHVGAHVAYHNIEPTAAASVETSPLRWLAPRGHGLAIGTIGWRQGRWSLHGRGGGTIAKTRDSSFQYGGFFHGMVGLATRAVHYGAFVATANASNSWYSGGGLECTAHMAAGRLSLGGQVAGYWMDPLDGNGGVVSEARVRGTWVILNPQHNTKSTRIALRFEGAAGTDRVLIPWMRGGVNLDITAQRHP